MRFPNKRGLSWRSKGGREIANYLITKYKGQYRLKCEYDKNTNMFSRKLDGTFEDIDVYIDCQHNIRVFSLGQGVLQAYIPSKGRGRNIVRAVKETLGENVLTNIKESDSEVFFNFHAKHMNDLEPFLKPKTSGANISPFSSKNLPKNKSYIIPDEDQAKYKIIVEKLGKSNIIALTHTTNAYIKSLVTKKNTWDDIKADMAKKGLSGKTYIHSIGKWSEYISYLHKELGV